MSGASLIAIGWEKIAPPTLAIDTSGWIVGSQYAPNIRADPGAISIWENGGARRWQYWTGIANGWSGLKSFPADYAGGVGWLVDIDTNPTNPSFFTQEWKAATGSDNSAVRLCQIRADGAEFGNGNWWPGIAYLNTSFDAIVALGGGFGTFAEAQCFPSQDPYDPAKVVAFVSPADRNHLWVPVSNINDPSGAAVCGLVGFTPNNGLADSVVYVDIPMQEYVQNYAYPMFLFDNSLQPDAISYHPSGVNVFGQLRYNAPFPDFQASVLAFSDFRFSKGSITGPFLSSTNGTFAADYQPPAPAELRQDATNNTSTRYFPNSGVPGWAWEAVADQTGLQQQQFASCRFDAQARPFGGVHDGLASVSAFRPLTGPPDVNGIVYTPYWQGFQGAPIGVDWPVGAVSPWYGIVWNGGVYLIDSATPTQMFALVLQTAQFAGLYGVYNWRKIP